MSELLAQRLRAPTEKCANPYRTGAATEFARLNVSALPNNLAPFLNRCALNRSVFASNHNEWAEMFLNSRLGFVHNFKAAGTTVQESLHRLAKRGKLRGEFVLNQTGDVLRWNRRFLAQSQYTERRAEWLEVMSAVFLFSMVRDPIERVLSAFFEVSARQSGTRLFQRLGIDGLQGIHRLRALLTHFVRAKETHLMTDRKKRVQMKSLWSGEAHLHPQTLFLLAADLSFFPFDFVGDLKDFDAAMRAILFEFVWPYLEEHPRFIDYALTSYRRRAGNPRFYGDALRSDFNLERANLSDADVRMICEVYWVDYLCLPFKVPAQCNVTELMRKHYGAHLTFNHCYFV